MISLQRTFKYAGLIGSKKPFVPRIPLQSDGTGDRALPQNGAPAILVWWKHLPPKRSRHSFRRGAAATSPHGTSSFPSSTPNYDGVPPATWGAKSGVTPFSPRIWCTKLTSA
jgi:hypothetical protein